MNGHRSLLLLGSRIRENSVSCKQLNVIASPRYDLTKLLHFTPPL